MIEMQPGHPDSPLSIKAHNRQLRKFAKQRRGYAGGSTFSPRNERQAALLAYCEHKPVVFAVGPEGTGKTYVPARIAMRQLVTPGNAIEKIIVSRPTVAPARHRNGFLPGNANAKMKPWLVPIWDAFKDETSAANLDRWEKEGKIEVVPFEFMRGRTFDGAVILLDEAQNCMRSDLKLVLTRTGEDSQVYISGDAGQSDIGDDCALEQIIALARLYDVDHGLVRFDENDVVRSRTAFEWVRAFAEDARRVIH